MTRRGFKRRDDVRDAWRGADAGLSGANGLVLAVLLGLTIWRVMT